MLFTDDDVQIGAYWIVEYCSIIDRYKPSCSYSKIFVIWDQAKPWWYLDKYQVFFVKLDYGDNVEFISDLQREFFGKNFCINREVLIDFGGFDSQLGRCGDKLIAGEEALI